MKKLYALVFAYLCSCQPAVAGLQICPRMPVATAVSNQWVSAINAAGQTTLSQPAFTNISGSVAASQMPAFTGDITTSAGAVATTLATVNSNVGTFGDASNIPAITVNAKGLITAVTTNAAVASKPSGEVFMTAALTCPTGSIAADGSSLLRSGGSSCGGGSCAALFTAISTTYGTADGTHFTLPNMKGVFARGAGTQGSYTGTQNSSLNADTTKKNGLALTDPGHSHTTTFYQGTVGAGGGPVAESNLINSLGVPTSSATTGITLGTGDAETRPANIVLLYCIAY